MQNKPFGFWMCTSLIVGNMIGMGIFMLPASLAPFGLNAFAGWAIVIVGSVFLARLFARLARAMPREDGPYAYTMRAFGPWLSFLVMWTYWVSIWVYTAALAIGVVGYLAALFPGLVQASQSLALGLVWLFVVLNLFGARSAGRMQVLTTLLKIVPLVAVMGLGLWAWMGGAPAAAIHVPATPLSLGASVAAGAVAMFSMLGVECATIPAGKVENPETTIPRATLAGTLATAAIYVGVCAVPMLLLPQQDLAQSGAPFADLFARYAGADASRWLSLFVVISGFGALHGWTLLGAEVTASFARHGAFPSLFERTNRFGAPMHALLLLGVMGSAVVAMNYSRSLAAGFTFLSLVVTAANMPMYCLAVLALLVLWRRGSVQAGRAAGILLDALASILFFVLAWIGMGLEAALWSIALCALGLPVYHFMRKERSNAARSPLRHPV